MKEFIADFHIHSKYSHATSKSMDLLALAVWGQLKGIRVMGTGDFTHPMWQAELKQRLEVTEGGLLQLKPEYQNMIVPDVYQLCKASQKFMLTAEISTIFKRGGRCYRVHSILLAPDFIAVDRITNSLGKIGNLVHDGRPILGCDVKELLTIVLDASPDCMLIPAHIWTPWFGLLGSKSGFDSVHDAFEELEPHIYALETGLSSSFAMNAQLSSLDRYALLCNSDAHSVQNLGREANLMRAPLSYEGITSALRKNDKNQLLAGIEFFPESGKYFGDGHRSCNVYFTPEKTVQRDALCVGCGKQVTVGVASRVLQLADRTADQAQAFVKKSYQIVPLLDILEQEFGVRSSSKKVMAMYHQMLEGIGNEFYILLKAPFEHIAQVATPNIARTIVKIRQGEVTIQPGYDGVYGQVLW